MYAPVYGTYKRKERSAGIGGRPAAAMGFPGGGGGDGGVSEGEAREGNADVLLIVGRGARMGIILVRETPLLVYLKENRYVRPLLVGISASKPPRVTHP